MEVNRIDDDGVWNYALKQSPKSQLLQSWEWGIFQQTLRRKVHHLQLVEDGTVLALLQCFEHTLAAGKRYLYAPRGPVVLVDDPLLFDSIVHHFTRALQELAKSSGAVFVRIEPSGSSQLTAQSFVSLDYRSVPSVQPGNELFVRVNHEEPKLLAAMHEKTRYNIRLALKRGVRTRLIEEFGYARRAFPAFWKLIESTAERQNIKTHDRSYYERMLEVLMPKGVVKMLVAEFENEIICANLLGVFGDTVTYLHGGSSYEHRALMAPYLLHWEGIRITQQSGLRYYNLGGISPEGAVNDKWENLTHFKQGFVTLGETGEHVTYIGGLDLVTRPLWYRMYGTAKKIKKMLHRR
ncbi:MAG: peptidoglycan bridge formation glycyltransferase FemA/FemB family protein [Patescibacteria group bacterium]|jgi:lipid II:glycine glycyltransferase (peptidoglycan interpeptide bridge formation enzyme)